MKTVKNLIKYTLGLPLLFVLTVGILVASGMNLIFSVVLGDCEFDSLFEELKYIWKPLK
jgi:hypothetical protein